MPTTVPSSERFQTIRFPDINSLLDHATANWRDNFVTTSIYDESIVEALSRRPFFILLHIDAPISVRWQRFREMSYERRFPQALEAPPTEVVVR